MKACPKGTPEKSEVKRMKELFIDGGEIYLRLPSVEDLGGRWHEWLNDPVVTLHQNKGIFPNTRERQREYVEKMAASENDVLLAVVTREGDRHIGCVGLHRIDWVHRSAELGIVIGEKDCWGRGYGKLAWMLMTVWCLIPE